MLREEYQRVLDRIKNLPTPRPHSALFRTPAEAFAEPWLPPLSTHRARLSKRRKARGLHCVSVLLPEEALDALVKLDFLPRERRASRAAIHKALAQYLYASLIERFENTLWAKAERQRRAAQPRGTMRAPNGRFLPWLSRKSANANLDQPAP